ncbi:30S ribosomal protein S27ae [Candidatus Burarchaeum australiense]|nr:30S ribosomal protein S27ae [Candidatus Burarchaeum australiense]
MADEKKEKPEKHAEKKPDKKKKFKAYKKLRTCPKCGSSSRLAEHPDRLSCGKCGYMEHKNKA